MAKFLEELSQLAALPYYRLKIGLGAKEGSLTSTVQTTAEGVIIGHRYGYVMAVGLVRAGWSKSVALLVRFLPVVDPEALKKAVTKDPKLKKFSAARMVGQDTLVYQFPWPFGFTAAKACALIDELLSVVSQFASPLKPHACEKCGGAADLVLKNCVPTILCSACQSSVATEQQRLKGEYDAVETDYFSGTFAALAGALIYALVWGVGGHWLSRAVNGVPVKLWAVMPFLGAALVAKLYSMGAKKITPVGMVITAAATAIAAIAGDTLFFSLQIMQHYSVSLGAALRGVLRHLWEIKTDGFYEWLVTAMDVSAVVGSAFILREMRPKFKADFQVLRPETMPTNSFAATNTR
jgi:hypothetical protein